jgi:predicted ribosome quality control (RQC) complex YloA/Tae2 family protein
MPFDAFTISHTAIELKNALVGGKINKITQPSNEEVVFTLYAQ